MTCSFPQGFPPSEKSGLITTVPSWESEANSYKTLLLTKKTLTVRCISVNIRSSSALVRNTGSQSK